MNALTVDRASRATAKMRKLLPMLTKIARALSRNPQMVIHLTSGKPRTDEGGNDIWLRVPITLGDDLPHDGCSSRDDDGVLICEACKWEEDTLITLCHELAHQIFDSFASIDESDIAEIVVEAVQAESNGSQDRADRIAKRIEKAVSNGSIKNYVNAGGLVSPYFPLLLNVLEDARVNAEMMFARPGTAKMFVAQNVQLLRDGCLQNDGSYLQYSELEPNRAMTIGLYLHASGQPDLTRFLDPRIAEDAADSVLVEEVYAAIQEAETVRQTYRITFKALERLRELGYMKSKDDEPDDEPEPEKGEDESEEEDSNDDDSQDDDQQDSSDDEQDGDDDSDEQDSDDGDDTGDPEEDSAGGESDSTEENSEQDDDASGTEDSDGEPESESDSSSAESGDGGGGEPDEESSAPGEPTEEEGDAAAKAEAESIQKDFDRLSHHDGDDVTNAKGEKLDSSETKAEEELVEKAINQLDHFDDYASGVDGLDVFKYQSDIPLSLQEGAAWRNGYSHGEFIQPLDIDPGLIVRTTSKLRRVFQENKRDKYEHNLKRGAINAKVLGRRAPFNDPRLFKKTTQPGKRDYFVILGADISGSTQMGQGSLPNAEIPINQIRLAVFAQAEMLKRLGIDFAIYCHTGTTKRVVGDEAKTMVNIYQIKSEKEPWGPRQQEALQTIFSESYNLDGHTMEFYRKRLQESRATDKILLYYTDGHMPLANYEEELEVLQKNLAILRKAPRTTVLGVGVGTDSPTAHGLETVRLDSVDDIGKVVTALAKKLT